MTNKTFFIAALPVVIEEREESRFNKSSIEDALNNMNIGASLEVIVSGSPTHGEYQVNTYKKVNDICVKLVKVETRG